MLQNYVPILIFLGVAALLGSLLIGLGFLFGPRRPDTEKLSAYECGFEPFSDARMKFDVRYYLVAILFIVFDLEIAFLFPWAVSLGTIGTAGLIAMGLLPADSRGGFHLRMEEGRARMGLTAPTAETPDAAPTAAWLRHDVCRQAGQLGAHGFDVADDVRSRVLCGGNDACRCGAL